MVTQALSDLKVVEYSNFISGPYCAKLMADLGAEVIKVEKPGLGDKARRYGPFFNDNPHPEQSGLFLYLNTNKLGITLDVQATTGAKLFKELIKETDILIENNPPEVMGRLGLDYESLWSVNPRLIITSITGFGWTGPYRNYKATELITFHMSGLGYGTPGQVQEPEQEPPLKVGGHQAQFVAGVTGAVGTMHAIFARNVTGLGQHVDVSEQEAMASLMFNNLAHYSYEHKIPGRLKGANPSLAPIGLLRCKNGHFALSASEERMWQSWVEVMGNPEWASSELFKNRNSRNENQEAMDAQIEQWAMQYTKEEIYRAAQAKRVPVFPNNTVEDLVKSDHLATRDFFTNIEHPLAGKIKFPGAPYKFSETPWRIVRPAPLLGEHNEEILCGRLGYSKEDIVKMREAGIV